MPAIKRILCPIDFSESSVLAFDYAQSVAWPLQSSCVIATCRRFAEALLSLPCFSGRLR